MNIFSRYFKNFALLPKLLVLLAIIGASILGLFIRQVSLPQKSIKVLRAPTPTVTSSPAVSWKPYTSRHLKLSFQYPADFTVSEEALNSPRSGYAISIRSNRLSLGIEPFIGRPLRGAKIDGVTIDGEPAVRNTIQPSTNNTGGVAVDVYHEAYEYHISFRSIGFEKLTDGDFALFNQFLSTVTFTDISAWKAYQSKEGKFQISYPGDYTLEKKDNWIRIISPVLPGAKTNFFIDIQSKPTDGTLTLRDAIEKNKDCSYVDTNDGQPYSLGRNEAVIYPDTRCGQWGATIIYSLIKDRLYRVSIEQAAGPYEDIQKYIEPILSTFLPMN